MVDAVHFVVFFCITGMRMKLTPQPPRRPPRARSTEQPPAIPRRHRYTVAAASHPRTTPPRRRFRPGYDPDRLSSSTRFICLLEFVQPAVPIVRGGYFAAPYTGGMLPPSGFMPPSAYGLMHPSCAHETSPTKAGVMEKVLLHEAHMLQKAANGAQVSFAQHRSQQYLAAQFAAHGPAPLHPAFSY